LPLDSFVFIDDNPLEIEEVSKKLPDVTCILFPSKTEKHIVFINQIIQYFDESNLTSDDLTRTEMYKSRATILNESKEHGADLTDYLSSLDMQLSYSYCNKSNCQRALQLINKTNQFNLNGKKLTEEELLTRLEQNKESLITFSLKDRFGMHGQVCCILIDQTCHISRFVMSCRVFQRQIEYVALLTLFNIYKTEQLYLNHIKTERNTPMQLFLSEFTTVDTRTDSLGIDKKYFENKYRGVLNLFDISLDDKTNNKNV